MFCQKWEQEGDLSCKVSRGGVFGETPVHLLSPPFAAWSAGVGPSLRLSYPAASPKPAAQVPVTSAHRTTCPPPPPTSDVRVSSPHMSPCADVLVPGSSLRGEREPCLMCDETESSEPLRGSGRSGGRGGDDGYQGR